METENILMLLKIKYFKEHGQWMSKMEFLVRPNKNNVWRLPENIQTGKETDYLYSLI